VHRREEFRSDHQPPEACEPGVRPFADPAVAAQLLLRLDATAPCRTGGRPPLRLLRCFGKSGSIAAPTGLRRSLIRALMRARVLGHSPLSRPAFIASPAGAASPVRSSTAVVARWRHWSRGVENRPRVRRVCDKTRTPPRGRLASRCQIWSGRLDLNQRPPAPEAGALPGYATPRRTARKDLADAPGGTRIPNLLIRSQMLYPIELRALTTRRRITARKTECRPG
jgi:hypothetical protein